MHRISHSTRLSVSLMGLILSLFGLVSFLFPFIHGNSGVSPLGFVNTTYAACTADSLYTDADCGATIINQCVGDACTSGIATTELKGALKDKVATGGTFTDYIQSIVVYLLGFVALICVLLIIYQGGKIMVSGGNEEVVKNAKKTIVYAFLGVILIFLAYSITIFVIGDKDGKGGILQAGATSFRSSIERQIGSVIGVDTAQALQDPEIPDVMLGTFDEYKFHFDRLMIKVFLEQNSTGVKSETIQELTNLIDQSSLTLPDDVKTVNAAKIAKIKVALSKVLANPKSKDEASGLEGLINGFKEGVNIGRISGEIGSSANSGNAPLTVTFRANNVKDPSGKKIPNENYVWWFKGSRNEKVIIGRGVSFLYSFPDEKIYTVFLDVTSDSKNVNGKTDVLPLHIRTDINVLPKLANISLFINGINVNNLSELKVTPGQARNGLVIDATASTSKDGSQFVSTEWDFGNGRSTSYFQGPRLERQIYAREGDYNISLALKNNSSEVTRKTITLKVRDPIASIVTPKTSGSLQDDFRFTTTTANSRLNLVYDWIIIDNKDNRDIARIKGGTLNYRFKKVGEYTVKLNATTVDNKTDTDFVVITIDPRPPVANFALSKFSSEQPNVLRLNATQSIDPDTNSADQLKYRWKIDGQPRELIDTQRNGAIGVYKLSEIGEHTVDLEVISPNGLSTTTSKKITIDSLLGADLKIAQKIVRVGDPMLFVANAPEAKIFVWNFGDGVTTNPVPDSKMSHVYNRSGIYTVRLTIRADNTGIANTVSRVVYVGDSDTPVPLISISQAGETVIPEVGVCGVGKEGYTISRLSSIDISARDSLNVDGTTQNLSYSWKANGKTSSLQTFPYSFDELGCFPIRLSVRSNQSGASASREIWVKVDNIPPTLSGLSVTSADTTKDPVIVNVNAINAQDPDGVITSYIWSYWTKTDSEPQGLRVTRAPQTTFVLPRIDDTYYFGVILEDSNGVKSKSVDLLSQDAAITLQSDNSNTPLITLKSSLAAPANTVIAGKQVTFTTNTTNLLDDNITDRTIFKWDFDGDGFYDKNATGSTATYTYQRPGIYRAKVKALYKGVSNTRTITITVTNDLKPSFDYIAIGRMIVLVNSTRGVYNNVTWELPDGATSNELDSITMILPEGKDQADITMRVSDGDKEVTATDSVHVDTRNIKTAASSNGTILLSQPRAVNNSVTIDYPDDKVTLYISSQGNVAKYAIDDNLNVDSNLNGDAADDEDNRNSPTYRNGGVYVVKGFNDRDASRTVRVTFYDSNNQKIDSKEIVIKSSFVSAVAVDPEPNQEITEIREQDRANLEALREMIQSQVPEASRATFMSYFGKLKDEWYDQNQKTTTIIEFEKAIASAGLDPKLVTDMNTILESFLATDDALGKEVSTALNTIRGLIPPTSSYAEEVMGKDGNGGLLKEIIDAPNNLEENKAKALKILSYVKDDPQITVENKNILKSQLKIIIYHGSENIPSSDIDPSTETPRESSSSGGFMGTIILIGQVLGILFGVVVGLILMLLVFFKITNKNDAIGFQDWIIEKLFQHGHDDGLPGTPVKPSTPSPVTSTVKPESIPEKSLPETSITPLVSGDSVVPQNTVDPLAQVSSVPSPSGVSETQSASTESLPSWLKNAVDFNPTPTIPPSDPLASSDSLMPETVVQKDIPVESTTPPEIPDWLKSISSPSPTEESVLPSMPISKSINEGLDTQNSSNNVPSSELPSWLTGTSDANDSVETLNATVAQEDLTTSENQKVEGGESTPSSEKQEIVLPSSEIPDWLQGDVSVAENESATHPDVIEESIQETSPFSLSPMDVSLGVTSQDTSVINTAGEQQSSENPSTDTTTDTTESKPRKPRRKSKVQLQEEQGDVSSGFSLNAPGQVVSDGATAASPNASVPNSDLPEWLRS